MGRTHLFDFEHSGQALLVRGRVPNSYLKQLLQCALQELGDEIEIKNQGTVASVTQYSPTAHSPRQCMNHRFLDESSNNLTPMSELEPLKILIVDDNAAVATPFRRLLQL